MELPEGLEVRVHGIGDHHLLSALGSPRFLIEGKQREATVLRPPVGVNHDLILVNWSRMSRRPWGPFFWYLAFPFTLVNVAFEMRPSQPGWRQRVHTGVLGFWSLILTGVTACWLIALSESLSLFLDFPDDWGVHRLTLAVALGAAFLVLVTLVRAARHPESRMHLLFGIAHACLVAVIAVLALAFRPGDWQINDNSWVRFFTVQGPTNDQITSGSFDPAQLDQAPLWLDPVGLISYLVLALCILVAIILLAAWMEAEPGPAAGASLVVLLSGVLTILITSSVHAGVTQLVAARRDWLPVFGSPDEILPAGALMSRLGRSYPTTLLPLIGLILLLFLLLSLLFWARKFSPTTAPLFPRKQHREEFLRWAHHVVGGLPRILILTSVTFVCFALALGFGVSWLVHYIEDKGESCTFQDSACLPDWVNFLGWIIGSGAVVGFFIVRKANTLPALKNVLASTADVIGFWPITLQPLGARTYRKDAVEGITAALTSRPDQRRVLVGHSQGSVLAAWVVAHQALGGATNPALVTCGSPLGSLYFKFFPRTFNGTLFDRIVTKSDGWVNFWRATDPIADDFVVGSDENVPIAQTPHHIELQDPPAANKPVNGHGDYWIADEQLSRIEDYFNPNITLTSGIAGEVPAQQ